MRLLVDHNLPPSIANILATYGFSCSTAKYEGWTELTNGNLIQAAVDNGFTGIITKDIRFHLDGESVFKKHPTFSIVIVVLPQAKKRQYLEMMDRELKVRKLILIPGKVVSWP